MAFPMEPGKFISELHAKPKNIEYQQEQYAATNGKKRNGVVMCFHTVKVLANSMC